MRFRRWIPLAAVAFLLVPAVLVYAEPSIQPPTPHSIEGREDCLACHEEGVAGATQIPEDHLGRLNESCLGCHAAAAAEESPTPVRVVPTPLVFPQRGEANTCLECHRALGDEGARIAAEWESSLHSRRGVTCAHCHGGDPAAPDIASSMSEDAGYIGVPVKASIPALCASCHSDPQLMRQYNIPTDQWAKFQESAHGQRLEEGDTRVATCFDCHGGHAMNPANEPSSSVYPTNIPPMCATCHSDDEYMRPYDLPTDQAELYAESVHGMALLEEQDLRAPSCATCHGKHGAAPPGFTEVANVCGTCHPATQSYYAEGEHALPSSGAVGNPKCVTCHGQHDIVWTSEDLFLGDQPGSCGDCHGLGSERGEVAVQMYEALAGAAQSLDEAELVLQEAAGSGLIVAPEQAKLHDATTSLVEARAAQHNVRFDTLTQLTDEVVAVSEEVEDSAEKAMRDAVVRRWAMVVAVAAIGVTTLVLYLVKRELDRGYRSRGA